MTSAPLPSTCFPRELSGLSSSPILNTTESDPVPKDAPTAMRLQNSTVAQPKGMTPTMNTIHIVVGERATAEGSNEVAVVAAAAVEMILLVMVAIVVTVMSTSGLSSIEEAEDAT